MTREELAIYAALSYVGGRTAVDARGALNFGEAFADESEKRGLLGIVKSAREGEPSDTYTIEAQVLSETLMSSLAELVGNGGSVAMADALSLFLEPAARAGYTADQALSVLNGRDTGPGPCFPLLAQRCKAAKEASRG